MVNPFAYLWSVYSKPGGFHDMLSKALVQKPSTPDAPWRLVLYSDEVVPGNPVATSNKRKIWLIYFAFLEMDKHLVNEIAWCPLVAEQAHFLKGVDSGISQVFAKVIHVFFGALSHDMSKSGISLRGPDGKHVRVWAELDMLLQDGAAQKHVWGSKGEAGTRMCMLCKNLVSRNSELTRHDGTHSLVCS